MNKLNSDSSVKSTSIIGKAHFSAFFCLFLMLMLISNSATATPQGGNIVGGNGSIQQSNPAATVVNQHTQSMAINWDSFNLGSNESVTYQQPNANSVVLNRILDSNASQIFGRINANGQVFLSNPNGIVFGRNAQVNVGGLLATGLNINVDDFMRGDYSLFSENNPGVVINQGTLQAATGGSISLIGGAVQNDGLIIADMGRVNLASGSAATLNFDNDGLMSFRIDEAVANEIEDHNNAILNSGTIESNGGEVLLSTQAAKDVFANVVNNSGIIRATKVERSGGVVKLVGSGTVIHSGEIDVSGNEGDETGGTVHLLGDKVGVIDSANINASGNAGGGEILIGGSFQGRNAAIKNASQTLVGRNSRISANALVNGDGGEVIVWSDKATVYKGNIEAKGTGESGNGGFVEVSGKEYLKFDGGVDLAAGENGEAGTLLLDPLTITINSLADPDTPDINGDGTTGDDITALGDLDSADTGPLKNVDSIITDTAVEGLLVNTQTLTLAAQNRITVNASIEGGGNANLTMEAPSIDLNAPITLSGTGVLSGTATTVNVGSDGKIQNGIDVAATGATVNVAANTTYNENVNASKTDLILQGQAGTILSGGGSGDGITINGVTGVNVKDLNITNFARGVVVTGTDIETFTLENVDLINNTAGGSISNLHTLNYIASADADVIDLSTVDQIARSRAGATHNTLSYSAVSSLDFNLGASTADEIKGPSISGVDYTWNITNSGQGNIAFVASFSNVENLTGGAGNDVFTFGADGAISGLIDGGTQTLADLVNYSAVTGPVSVALDTDVTNIETLIGKSSGSELSNITNYDLGTQKADDINVSGFTVYTGNGNGTLSNGTTWTIDNADAGTVDGIGFSGFKNLTGTSGDDVFTLSGVGSVSGLIDGAGNATATGDRVSYALANSADVDLSTDVIRIESLTGNGNGTLSNGTTWAIDNADAGTVDGIGFSGFKNLTGTSGDDVFAFDSLGRVTGVVDGSGGSNTVVGANKDHTWDINDANQGEFIDKATSIKVAAFKNFANLTGGGGDDTFTFNSSGTISGLIDGASGSDTLDFSSFSNPIDVKLTSIGSADGFAGSVTNIVTTFDNVNEINASNSASSDSITGIDAGATWTVNTNGQYVSTNSLDFNEFEVFNGGEATDTFELTGAISNAEIDGKNGVDEVKVIGDFTVTSSLNLSSETVSVQASAGDSDPTITAQSLVIEDASQIGGAGASLLTSVDTLSIINSTADTFILEAGDIDLAGIDVGSNLFNLESAAGSISNSTGVIKAKDIVLKANASGESIGTTSSPIQTEMTGELTAETNQGSGGVYISQAGDLNINSIDANQGIVQLNATGSVLDAIGNDNDVDIFAADVRITNAGSIGRSANDALNLDVNNLIVSNSSANAVSVTDENNFLQLAGVNVGGDFNVVSKGIIIQTGAIKVLGDSFIDAGSNAILLADSENLFSGTVSLNTTGTSGSATLENNGDLILAASNVGGALSVSANGSIKQSGALNVGGTSTFNADNAIELNNTNNRFAQSVALNAKNAQGNVDLFNTVSLDLAESEIGGDLIINTLGNITQSGKLTVAGMSTFNAGDNSILINNQDNLFGDTVALNTTSANGHVDIHNNAALNLAASDIGGNLTVNAAGPVGQTGDVKVGGISSINSGANAINLNRAGNDFVGAVAVNTQGSDSHVALTDSNSLQLADSVIGGDLNLVASNGELVLASTQVGGNLNAASNGKISQSASLTVAGNSEFSAGSNAIELVNENNALSGEVKLTTSGSTGNVALTNTQPLVLAESSVGGNLTAQTNSSITQTGALTIGGKSDLKAGSGVVTLDNQNNDFVGSVSVSNSGDNAVTLVDRNNVALGVIDAEQADVSVTANSGNISSDTSVSTVNINANAVSLTANQIGSFNAPINVSSKTTTTVQSKSETLLTGNYGELIIREGLFVDPLANARVAASQQNTNLRDVIFIDAGLFSQSLSLFSVVDEGIRLPDDQLEELPEGEAIETAAQ